MDINRNVFSLTALLGLVICASCSGGKVVDEFKDVDTDGWTSADTVSFDLPKTTRGADLKAEIGVRLSDSYTYEELYMTTTLLCEGEELSYDTIRVAVYNPDGGSKGQGFPFATVMQEIPTVHVDSGLTYTYRINHIMTPDTLKGICGIGLKLEVR